jgi:hypothetical protein
MRRFRVSRVVLVVLFPFFTAALASGVTPNPKLLSLVPPEAQIVAGMSAPHSRDQPSSFLLITRNNTMDLNDFIALSGVDSSRSIEQVIMVAADGGGGNVFAEHSLLAIGHFDQALIYRSVYKAGAGAIATNYRGIPVLEMQPFARERDSFHDVRWLAMMDSNLALFGTISILQQELNRYLAHSVADPVLERRLAHLRRDNATWYMATLPHRNSEIQTMFQFLDARLAELLRAGDTLLFGIHYGRRVEFEYEVETTSGRDAEVAQRSFGEPVTRPRGSSLLPIANLSRIDNGVRGDFKVSKDRYEAWLAEVVARTDQRAAAGSSRR